MADGYRMDDKVALVMGGSTGIGARCAHLLAQRGAKVVVAAVGQTQIDQTVGEIVAAGGTAIGVETDLADEQAVIACMDKTIATFGKLNVVHANAAATYPDALVNDKQLADLDFDWWDKIMAVNLRGLAATAKHAIPHMIKAGGGAFVFSGSGRGSQGHLEYTTYGVSKAGIEGLSSYVATQYGKSGIRSNVIEIGLVMTDSVKTNLPPEFFTQLLEHHLVRELAGPNDIAQVVAFLLSDEARFVTGAKLAVDGGLGSHTPVYADQLRMMSGDNLQV
jgi:NAD(P)-dependent dehydrogenase (short-subunit alcohol dehydrogenase family)